MEEYVKVIFPTRCSVRVDGQAAGFTNQVLQVETGHHTFDLKPEAGYRPETRTLNVKDTLPEAPLIIAFERAR